jgi:hypothetical protein
MKLRYMASMLLTASGAFAAAPPTRYTVSNGTVLDSKTSLRWQQGFSPMAYTFGTATANYCATLNASALGGFSAGWRVPTIKELQTLVDVRIQTGARIDLSAFQNTPPEFFWSSSLNANLAFHAWVVNFTNGNTDTNDVDLTRRVRCVR